MQVGERPDDPGHQPVPSLGALVGIGVRPHRDAVALPPLGGELATQDLGCVHLDDDLGLEVAAGAHVEERVGGPGEAIRTGMGASSIRLTEYLNGR